MGTLVTEKKLFYALFCEDHIEGMFSSKEKLAERIDYISQIYPDKVQVYYEWQLDEIEPRVWDWAFIPLSAIPSDLNKGGATVPYQKYFGLNLITNKWEGGLVVNGIYESSDGVIASMYKKADT